MMSSKPIDSAKAATMSSGVVVASTSLRPARGAPPGCRTQRGRRGHAAPPLPVQRPFGPQPGTSLGDARRPPGEGHRHQVLAETVIDPIEDPCRGGTAPGHHALRAQRGVEHPAARVASSVRSRSMKAAPTTKATGTVPTNRTVRRASSAWRFGPGRGEGTARGVGDPFTRTS